MKKAALFSLLFCLLTLCLPAPATAAVHSAYRLSFEGHMIDLFSEPGGRWLDELLELVSLRAERITWESGSFTRLDFIIKEDVSAASLAVLELSDDLYLSGSLFPEVPLLFYDEQLSAATTLCEALFPKNGRPEDPGPVDISVSDLSEFTGSLINALDQAVFPQENSMLSFIRMLNSFSEGLSECDPDALALQMVRETDVDGAPPMENVQYTSDVAVERLLRALVTSIARSE